MGLYGKIGWCRPVGRTHKQAAREALDLVGMADLARGRRAAPGVDVLVTTARETRDQVLESEWAGALETFGVTMVTDTCTYLLPAAISREGTVVTNSAKYAHYGPGNVGRKTALMSLERCMRCAEQGKIVS